MSPFPILKNQCDYDTKVWEVWGIADWEDSAVVYACSSSKKIRSQVHIKTFLKASSLFASALLKVGYLNSRLVNLFRLFTKGHSRTSNASNDCINWHYDCRYLVRSHDNIARHVPLPSGSHCWIRLQALYCARQLVYQLMAALHGTIENTPRENNFIANLVFDQKIHVFRSHSSRTISLAPIKILGPSSANLGSLLDCLRLTESSQKCNQFGCPHALIRHMTFHSDRQATGLQN